MPPYGLRLPMSQSEDRGAIRAADRAYQMLRRDIVTGALGPGLRLGEVDLAEQYGLSRTPIRESLRRLASEGLVEVLPHRGARVVDWAGVDLGELYGLRARVEGYAARSAATRIRDEEIDRLSTLCDDMERITRDGNPGDPQTVEGIAELNSQLHGSVADVAGNYYLDSVRNIVVVAGLVLRGLRNYTSEDLQRSNNHHRDLLAAFRARDPDWAEAVMLSHMHAAKVRVLRANDRTVFEHPAGPGH